MTPLASPSTEPGAAIFDFDGLLADTASIWKAAECCFVAQYGFVWRDEDHRSLRGSGLDHAVAVLNRHVERDTSQLDATSDELLTAYRSYLAEVVAMPGARLILDCLDLPLAVASNSPGSLVERQLEALNMRHQIGEISCADEVTRSKPAPDVYLRAAHLLATPPDRCLAFEDSQPGVDAAHDAGCIVIGVSRTADLERCWQVDDLHEAIHVAKWLSPNIVRGDVAAALSFE